MQKFLLILLIVILFFNSPAVFAEKSDEEKITGSLSGEKSITTPFVRYAAKSGVIRYIYSKVEGTVNHNPYRAAENFLQEKGRFLGIEQIDESLSLRGMQVSAAGTHILYTQNISHIPVYNSELVITLDNENRVVFVANNYRPALQVGDLNPTVSQTNALESARSAVNIQGKYFVPPELELMILADNDQMGRLIYRVRFATDNPRGDWEIFVDAKSGQIIARRNRMMFDEYVTGSGAVFDPDPITSAGVYYGGDFTDPEGSDLDSPALNNQRILVDLPEITYRNNMYELSGPYVKLVNLEAPLDNFPVLDAPDGFMFTRNQQEFEAVMVYYHIDKSYRYLNSLGFDIPELFEFKVDPHGANGEDNSYYMGGAANFCVFGEGGVDDAEDASVIWHEYAHAIQEKIVIPNGMIYTGETKSLQEGSSDYWAASYARSVSEFGWQHVFMWDAGIPAPEDPGIFWQGRRCDTDMKYPDDYDYTPNREHYNGQIWASALMHIQEDLGRDITDEIFIQTHYLWGSSPGFTDAARAFIQADSLLYNGVHTSQIVPWFIHHGIINAGEYLPVVHHQEHKDTENIYGPYDIRITVTPAKADLDSNHLWMYYGYNDAPFDSIRMMSGDAENEYQALLPGPGENALVHYYFLVGDSLNSVVLNPFLAPLHNYSFFAGPDLVAPEAYHKPIYDQSLLRWPPEVKVNAVDNTGIKDVYALYAVNTTASFDTLFLSHSNSSVFSANFPVLAESLTVGDTIFYCLQVNDIAENTNMTRIPLNGWYRFRIIEGGGKIVINFDQDNDGFVASGDWEWGNPVNGPGSAFSGGNVWATVLNGIYHEGPGLSSLISPEIDLTGFQNVSLQFWHWYDIEQYFDGGNLKISDDQGTHWRILTPLEGYRVVIDTSYGNPLGGEIAFSGQSNGWIKCGINLDQYAGHKIQLRFDFGSDMSKTMAGWYIDSLVIMDQEVLLKAPAKLAVADNRDVIRLEWDPSMTKLPSAEISEEKVNGSVNHKNKPTGTSGLPAYRIYKANSGSDFILLDSTTNTIYTDSLVLPGILYSYYITAFNGEMESNPSDTVSATIEPLTSINSNSQIPREYALFQNYPNPFNPETIIEYDLPRASDVLISIYSITGAKVRNLVSGSRQAGHHFVSWNGMDENGKPLASGLYFYVIHAEQFTATKKMILLR